MPVDRSSSDEALRGLRIADTRYCRTELSAPWGLEMQPCPIVTFHFVAHGRCLLAGAGDDRWLETGQFVVFARGSGHRLLSAPGLHADPVTPLPKQRIGPSSSLLRHGGGGESTLLLCGGSSFVPSDHPLVTLLPEVLTIVPAGHLSGIMPILEAEAARPGVGSDAIVTRLSDILILHAVRTWLQTAPHNDGWLGALRDEGLGRALSALHQAPERGWTVAALAAQARMSRSLFARRFTEMLGNTPMDYVAEVRMRHATSLMREHSLSLGQVATRVGYQSPAAFSRAYKRVTGRSPGAARTAGG
ncbi:MAG: AraC family transcriptional regulator [Catenulisporales bacterium]|nr:AraC family transcriptional regulator [Catenulisporales bacterium]